MVKNFLIKTIKLFVVIVIAASVITSCNSSKRDTRQYFTTYTDKYVTVCDDYIIFEKYDGNIPPTSDFIRIDGDYKAMEVCFKSNDTIVIFSRSNLESFDVKFDTNKYYIEIYGNTREDYKKFYQRSSYADPSTIVLYSLGTTRHRLEPRFFEIMGDSVYMKAYNVSGDILSTDYEIKNSVFSRYDERYNEEYLLH